MSHSQVRPLAMAELIRTRRVLAPRSLNLSSRYLKDSRIDILTYDWEQIAEAIAGDLDTGKVFSRYMPVLLEATYQPGRPATELTAHFAPDDQFAEW